MIDFMTRIQRRLGVVGILGVFCILALGCGSDAANEEGPDGDAGETSTSSGFKIEPPPATSGKGPTGMSWDVPSGWNSVEPSSSMRRAQYRVPGPGGDAEMIVFYFGPGQGGDVGNNARRWSSQFKQADGTATPVQTKRLEVNGMKVLRVSATGTYTNQMVSDETLPDYRLLGAIAEGPDANWFFKMVGPRSTVDAQEEAFGRMIESLR